MEKYTFKTHKHNYAIWTAARAVQRNFTNTTKIKQAIEASNLREYAEIDLSLNPIDFDSFHKKCSKQLIQKFEDLGIPNVSYGRVAKIIAIYLKTSVIMLGKNDEKSISIHPPIDRILLTNISKIKALKGLKEVNWTQLDENEYWNLIQQIKQHFEKFDWTLEEFWTP